MSAELFRFLSIAPTLIPKPSISSPRPTRTHGRPLRPPAARSPSRAMKKPPAKSSRSNLDQAMQGERDRTRLCDDAVAIWPAPTRAASPEWSGLKPNAGGAPMSRG